MSITGSTSLDYIRSNVMAVFGPKSCTSLHSLDLHIPISSNRRRPVAVGGRSAAAAKDGSGVNEDDELEEGEDSIHVQGLISRPTHGSGRSSSDRIFLYINGRPWDSTRIVRAINEVYKSFNNNQFPMVVANFTIEGDRYDVNVSPDKRTLFLHDEGEIVEGIKVSL